MKLQKTKPYDPRKNKKIREDTSCISCQHWKGRKRGCALPQCGCGDEKLDLIKTGRFNRKQGSA